ncbi:MAG: YggT family protein [Nitrospirae bacterium]|nr:YggT family protein [Nitrospirota bacterium]
MEILKQVYYYFDYTLQFFMWLVIGRVAAQVVIRNPNNVILNMFIRFTEPLYNLIKKIFPFSRVPEAKKNSTWGLLDGMVPIILILGIFLILRPLVRIIVSVIVVNYK